MQRDRAWRRRQRELKIAEVERWMMRWNYYPTRSLESQNEDTRLMARRRHGAPAPCSRWCCGNPRVHFGHITEAETRFAISCEEQFDEAGINSKLPKRSKHW